MKTALFIGRFQPFHLGHIDALGQIEVDHIIIGVGSSQYSGTEKNPYTFEQREEMIITALNQAQGSYEIIPIPDIHDEQNWVDHVKKLVPSFDIVYTGNEYVARLFKEKEYNTRSIIKNKNASGSFIREEMKKKTDDWKMQVPEQIIPLLESYSTNV
jgi:nicotinamide-nucleotide adenylyltransferase